MTHNPLRRPVNVGELLRAADERPAPGHLVQVITEWSESCACGGNFLGHEEEPCRPDCTGYYPVAGWSYVAGASKPGDSGPTMADPSYA
ncbi:hypothetical protein ABZ404_34905 [Streptomyces sp. NPDC005878]|uniref:hypothetical protein n=1 Tax=Streptomyces sp. NPDC005878 TaxID=3157077 RepID=UPI0033E81B53